MAICISKFFLTPHPTYICPSAACCTSVSGVPCNVHMQFTKIMEHFSNYLFVCTIHNARAVCSVATKFHFRNCGKGANDVKGKRKERKK